MRAVVRAQLRDEVRIRQEAHIEDEISIVRNALAVSEADCRDEDTFPGSCGLKTFNDVRAQLVHGELRGIDNDVCFRADRRKDPALELDSGFDRLLGAERMRAAGLAEAADESFV